MKTDNAELPRLTFLLGGARSGKSAHALRLAEAAITADGTPPKLVFIATGEAGDEEMASRIARHQADRGPRWQTLETPLELSRTIREAAKPGTVIIVDCLTLWLSNLMHAECDIDHKCAEFLQTLAECSGSIILISNEAGLGIVPENALARAFRDQAGRLHQNIAALADRVCFIVAGLAMSLK